MKYLLPTLALCSIPACHAAIAPPQAGTLVWGATCHPDKPYPKDILNRLECGHLSVPLDRTLAASRKIWMPVMRLRAARPAERKGTLFYHPGGPGVMPLGPLTALANHWNTIDRNDIDLGDLRRISDHFDLVTLVPRGLTPDTAVTCQQFASPQAMPALSHLNDDVAWNRLVADAQAFATSCGDSAANVNTAEYVADIEAMRVAMGVDELHFYARSYGTWVATWYASLHPQTTGRMLLDATMSFYRRQWSFQSSAFGTHRERALWTDALYAAARNHATFGLGTSAKAIQERLKGMPPFMRYLWANSISFPSHVVGALAVADEWNRLDTANRSLHTLRERLETHVFHARPNINAALRDDALELLAHLYDDDGNIPAVPYSQTGAGLAVLCNDTRWRPLTDRVPNPAWTTANDPARAAAIFSANTFSLPRGVETLTHLVCSAWPHTPSERPYMEALTRLPSFMMIHASTDHHTPLGGAEIIQQELPNSYLLVTHGLSAHGMLGADSASCATRHAARYLLTGQTPSEHRMDIPSEGLPCPVLAGHSGHDEL